MLHFRYAMFKKLFMLVSLAALCFTLGAQDFDDVSAAKRAAHKNMTIKEWNTDAKSKTRWLDRVTTYDEKGRKVEEIEYTSYGQKWRETYKYDEQDRIVQEVEYDEKDKPRYVRKYEYNSDGSKKKQYNYSPSGKLMTIKVFEYIIAES